MILRVRFSNPRGPRGHFHWWFLLKGHLPHGASDNESSSSERLRALCHTGGATSHLHGRARPSIASLTKELVPVMMILPPFASGEEGEVIGMLGHLLACIVAITLGHHRPYLPLLAVSG